MHDKTSANSIHFEMNETTNYHRFWIPIHVVLSRLIRHIEGLKPIQGLGTCAPVVAPNQRKPTLFANVGALTATSRGPSGSRRK